MAKNDSFIHALHSAASEQRGSQAEAILASGSADRLGQTLQQLGYEEFKVVRSDRAAIVLESRGDQLQFAVGALPARPEIPEVLPAQYRGSVGELAFEVLPAVQEKGAEHLDQVAQLSERLRGRGFELRDAGAHSVAIYQGRAVVADVGALERTADNLRTVSQVGDSAKALDAQPMPGGAQSAGPSHVSFRAGPEYSLSAADLAGAGAPHADRSASVEPPLIVRQIEHAGPSNMTPAATPSTGIEQHAEGRAEALPSDLMIREPSGNVHTGTVIAVTERDAFLQVSELIAVRFDKEALSRELAIGESVSIKSMDGKGMVQDKDIARVQEQLRDQSLER